MTTFDTPRLQPPRIQLRTLTAQHHRLSNDEHLPPNELAAQRNTAVILSDSDPRNWRRNGEHSLEDLPDSEARELLRAAIGHRLSHGQLDPTTREMVRDAFDSMATPVPNSAKVSTVMGVVTATRSRDLAAGGATPPHESYASISSSLDTGLN